MITAAMAQTLHRMSIKNMNVESLDHLVLTVASIETTVAFYTQVMGMQAITFNGGRRAIHFGTQKINLHQYGNELEPKAQRPTPGSADLCFITATPLHEVIRHLDLCGVAIIEGPVHRTGATGALHSVYVRDPDMNLIEISNRVDGPHVAKQAASLPVAAE